MHLSRRGLALMVAASAGLAIPAGLEIPGGRAGTRAVGPRGDRPAYSANSVERFLTQEMLEYVRPGFRITVNSITIPPDRRPVVDLSFTDDLDQPLDRLGKVTPGALSISFILAWWDAGARHYTAYTTRSQTSPITGVTAVQAGTDSGGAFTDLELGHAHYKFGTALPEGYDTSKTHTLGIYATRNLTDIIGKNYFDNVEQDFRPDEQAVTEVWAGSDQEKSCNDCHNPLAAHGGARRDLKLCVLCHQPQTVDPDTGNTVDIKVMIHKIHRGEDLPSVQAGTPYQIIGFQQGVNDYSEVVFPQDIRNCTKCHETSAADAHIWYTRPSRAACASCHDDVNFVTGENHVAGPQADDSACASCHIPQGDVEFDASIKGAHTVPLKSTQLKGLKAEILSATNTAPGEHPVVTFRLTENDGTVLDPAPFAANLNLLLGGPTADYAVSPFRERASGASFNGTVATYTFTNAIPADATGTWAVSIEARRTITLNPGTPKQMNVTEGAVNPVFYVGVTDSAPFPRRAAVAIEKCNVCHDSLRLHGGQRLATEECVICHNPNGSDAARRPAEALPVESIDFKRLIHRIHTGHELTQDLTVYGFFTPPNPPNPVNFNELHFPGDRRDCETCHVEGAYQVKDVDPPGLLPTITLRDFYSPQQHYAAACLGCHDTQASAAHAFVMTAPFGESCAACHGNSAEFSVDKVHAR